MPAKRKMAKAKLDTKPPSPSKPPKKSISTSGIFKKARKQPSRKDEVNQQHPNKPPTFTLSNHASKKKPTLKQKQKHKATSPDHPLAKSFHESLSPSKAHITKEVTAAATSINSDLQSRISTSASSHLTRVTTATATDQILNLPLADEGIEYARRDGSQSSRTTLGAQIKMFQRKIMTEERVLEGLVEEWRGVQGELEGVAEGVFGVQWAGTLEGVEGGRLAEVLVKQGDGEGGGEGEAGMDKECKAFEELIKSTGEKAVEKMVESEKEFKLKQSERTQYMLKLFTDEDDVVEE